MIKGLGIILGVLLLVSKQGDAVITTQPISQSQFEGFDVTFNCSATASRTLTFTWTKDSINIASDSRHNVTSNNQSSTLVITGLVASDAGSYSCVANYTGNISTSNDAILTVKFAPKVTSHPANQTKVEGENATITCDVTGTPPIVVTWEKDGSPFSVSSHERFHYSNDGKQLDITAVKPSDSGSYVCVADNGVRVTSYPGRLTVHTYPAILAHPNGTKEVKENDNVTFTCAVGGKPSPSIQWMKNNAKLDSTAHSKFNVSGDGRILTITGVVRSDEGNFSCNATNKVGSVASSSTQLIVNYRPELISIQPNGTKEVTEKDTVTFTCGVGGKPSPSIQWMKNNAALNTTAPSRFDVSGDGRILTITAVVRSDEGNRFSCNATNKVGSVVSSSTLLIVNYPPKILVPPTSKTVLERRNVTLKCYLEGKPLSSVTWLKDGHPIIAANDNRISVSPPSSVSNTTAKMTITNVSRTDEGYYSCQALNDVANDTSSGALLTVSYPPKILLPPTSKTVLERSNVILTCFLEGKPLSNVTWLKDGHPTIAANGNRISVSPPSSVNKTSASITITNVSRTDEGYYSCQALNDVGNDTLSGALLTVNYPPRILVSPASKTVVERSNVSLTCYLEGKPVSNVTLLKDGHPIIAANGDRISVTLPSSVNKTSASISITNVSRTDEGYYSCQAVNDVGNDTSSGALLTVNYGVTIFVNPQPKSKIEGESVTFTCEVEGKPAPNVTWLVNDNPLTLETSRMNVTQPTTHDRTAVYLTINELIRTDEGSYHCRVNNFLDERTSTPALLAVYLDSPVIFQNPANLTKSQGDSMVMSCGVDGNPVPDITWKKEGRTLVQDGRINITKLSSVGRVYSTLTIRNLGWDDEGTYKCTANNTLNTVVSLPGTLQLAILFDIAFVNPEANFTVTEGQSSILVCVVSGVPSTITWYRDGQGNIPGSNTKREGSNTIAELTLNNVQAKGSGVYTCFASSNMRSISTQMTLVVKVPVEVDMGITIKNRKYSAELSNKSSLQFQNLSNTLKNEISSIYNDINGFKEVNVMGFSNSTVGVSSRFRVVFELKVDKPSNKPPLDIKQNLTNTAIEGFKNAVFSALKFDPDSFVSYVPPPSPRNLKAGEVNVKQISITWNKPEQHQSYGVTGYEVQYKEFGKEWINNPIHGQDVNDYVINDLKQETNYLVRMVAVNEIGKGPPTDKPLELKTKGEGLLEHIWNTYKWLIVCIAVALFILLLTWYCLCCRRRRRPVKRRNSFSGRTYDDFVLPVQGFDNDALDMTQLPASSFREIPYEQIMIGKELGSGQFGLVTRGYLKQDEKHCAIKMLKANASNTDYMDLMNELDIMSSIEEHPNIIHLIGACTQGGHLYVVVELAEYGSLLHFLHKNQVYSKHYKDKMCTLSEDIKLRIGVDVARGMKHLARHKCVHRDLAARNVLLGTNMTAKLSDFGLARDVYERGYYQQLSNMKKLPARWMSIEAIETLVATKESDIWSFGVLLWEIQTGGKMPFSGLSVKELLKSLKKGTRLSQPIGCSDQMYAVMMSCWESNPRKSPTIEHLITALDEQLSLLSGIDLTNPQTSDA